MKTFQILLTLVFLALISCDPEEETIPTAEDIVYITGTQIGVAQNQAMLFKDGISQTLQNSTNTEAKKVWIHNNDVYVLGNFFTYSLNFNSPTKAVLWKNGQIHWEKNGAVAHDLFFLGNDIYISGHLLSLASPVPPPNPLVYWKNGVENMVSQGSFSNSKIFVKGNDVHISAIDGMLNQNAKVKYFKNNQMTVLTESSLIVPTGIAVNENNNVYVSFYMLYNATVNFGGYWLNGVSNSSQAQFDNVKIYNNDIYFVGHESSGTTQQAFFIKNNQKTYLNINGNQGFEAKDIHVKNNNTYVLGTNNYWENGIFSPISANTNNNFQSTSIFIK